MKPQEIPAKAIKVHKLVGLTTSSARKKLWSLDHRFHCSVIGTCLSLGELSQIARKVGINLPHDASDYKLHVSVVGLLGQRCHANRLLQKRLDRKYRQHIRKLSSLYLEDEQRAYWQDALAEGEVAGAYWAVITHPGIEEDLLEQVYGEVHMLSHLQGATVRVDMQALATSRKKTADLQKSLSDTRADLHQRLQEKTSVIEDLKAQLNRATENEDQLIQAKRRLRDMESDADIQQLRARINSSGGKITLLQDRLQQTESILRESRIKRQESAEQNQLLEEKLLGIHAEKSALESTLERLLQPDCTGCANNCAGSQQADLCGRCVLYVGGRKGQYAHLRALVEQSNGHFSHHDGGREDSRQQLSATLSKADMVFCPLDAVSHDAMNKVKRHCEKSGKSLTFLPRASLSAFAHGLHNIIDSEH